MKIGFIGLGIMGSRMAANLQKTGRDLVVHNRTADKAQPLISGGAGWADSPAEVGRQVDVLFTMLATPEAVAEMAEGPQGFLETLHPGSLWVDSSTVNPSFSRSMAGKTEARQVRFLDAPVVGTRGPAEAGQLVFLVGGEGKDLEQCRPLLDAMGRDVIHAGGTGMGTAMKMVYNLLLGQAMLAFSEAVALGQAQGIERQVLLNTLLGGPVVPAFIQGKREKIEKDRYEADFPLKWMHKDLHLAAQTAYEHAAALPAGNLAKEMYAMAEQAGLGEQDFSAIFAFMNGRDVE